MDDIFTLIARADELNILSKLPTFVAADPDKLPNMNPEALDVCILAKKLSSLEQTVMRHEAQFGACTGMMSTISVVSDTDGGTFGDKHGGGNAAGAPADDQSWQLLLDHRIRKMVNFRWSQTKRKTISLHLDVCL